MRKKINLIVATILMAFGLLSVPLSVSAVDVSSDICGTNASAHPDICSDFEATKDPDTGVNPLYGPDGIITRATNGLSLLIGVVAILIIIIAGVKMTLSGGDSGKIKSSRDQIIYASVGLIVATLAQAIVRFVLNRIGA